MRDFIIWPNLSTVKDTFFYLMAGIASNEAYIVFDNRNIAPRVVVRTEKHVAVSVVYLSYTALRIGEHIKELRFSTVLPVV